MASVRQQLALPECCSTTAKSTAITQEQDFILGRPSGLNLINIVINTIRGNMTRNLRTVNMVLGRDGGAERSDKGGRRILKSI